MNEIYVPLALKWSREEGLDRVEVLSSRLEHGMQ